MKVSYAKLWILSLGAGLLLLAACAQVVSPQGGPKDKEPPQFLRANPAMASSEVRPELITLYFNEFLKLKNKRKNILFSPPVQNYELIRRKRSIDILLPKDSLKPNTTHTIQFGKAIRDITEGNPAKGFVYVFSTGETVDSLNLNGRVVDAFTRDSVSDASILLYQDPEPEAIKTKRPYFYTEADEQGQFGFQYLKAGDYQVYALKDLNNNLQYDPGEQVGLLGNTLTLQGDTVLQPIPLFEEKLQQPEVIEAKSKARGKVSLTFNQALDTFRIDQFSVAERYWHLQKQGAEGIIYHPPSADDSLELVLTLNKAVQDTVTINRSAGFAKDQPADTNLSLTLKREQVRPDSAIGFYSNHPLTAVDTNEFLAFKDSLPIRKLKPAIKGANQKQLLIDGPFKPDSAYRLIVDSGAITDLYGNSNDSVSRSVKVFSPEELGLAVINVEVPPLDRGQVILNLLDKDGNVLREDFLNTADSTVTYKQLKPGKYRIKAIVDRNGNGFWDEGEFFDSLRPEPVLFYPQVLDVKANWEMRDLTFDVEEMMKATGQ